MTSLFKIEGKDLTFFSLCLLCGDCCGCVYSVMHRCKKIEEQDYIPGLPKEYYDDVCTCYESLVVRFLTECVCVCV